MATWSSFYIKTTDVDKVIDTLKNFTGIDSVEEGNFPSDHYDSFLLDEILPNYLIIGSTQKGWVTIVYNSSSKLLEWCENLSKEFNTLVVLTLAQSVSDYYYFSYFKNGHKQREIELCYSTDIDEINFGKPFPFENIKPGKPVEFDGKIDFIFDFDSIEEYCQYLGLIIQEDHSYGTWKIIKGKTNERTIHDYVNEHKKRWWKFW